MPAKYAYENFYHHCGTDWSDPECDSMHNDRCPICNAEIEPYKSVENESGETVHHASLKTLKEEEVVNAAKTILDRIKGRDMQVFDVKTQAVHSQLEINALRAALRHFIEYKDRDFKVKHVVNAGQLNIKAGDTVPAVLQQAADMMESHETSEIIGGDILFLGTNGRWYTVVLESYVAPASRAMVKELVPAPVKVAGHTWTSEELVEIESQLLEDEVSLCEFVSKRFGVELTLAQAEKLGKTVLRAF